MKLKVEVNGHVLEFESEEFYDISIPLKSGSENPKCFYADDPEFKVIRQGSFVGSVAEGGSVNFTKVKMTPHGNGTHTECFGHISADEKATISKQMTSFLSLALLHTVPTTPSGDDQIVMESQFPEIPSHVEALLIRTLPNKSAKRKINYSGSNPAYFSKSFIEMVTASGIIHFLTDLPSVDREEDGGALASHRAFWDSEARKNCTITELIYVPDSIPDGTYLLNLQVPNFDLDAAPSRPLLFPIKL